MPSLSTTRNSTPGTARPSVLDDFLLASDSEVTVPIITSLMPHAEQTVTPNRSDASKTKALEIGAPAQ